jgi:tetratricopeptide (TPR) repeat protein
MLAQARAHAGSVSDVEQGYIEALAVRYAADPKADRAALDRRYADAMRALSQAHPDDADAAVLFTEALMDLHPWNWWPQGKPQPEMEEIVEVLEWVLKRQPDHIGACHYYIHAVEASPQPGRAAACADRLPGLAPAAGHLVHMPAHIYMRVGRYADAAERNTDAVAVDRHYLSTAASEGRAPAGMYPVVYYPHNVHFLWAALIMQGRREDALRAARDLVPAIPAGAAHEPALEPWFATPILSLARFGRWDDVLKEPEPDAAHPVHRALRTYARALARIARGELPAAEEELRRLAELSAAIPADRHIGNSDGRDVLQVAALVVKGELAARRGRWDEAVAALEGAVRHQDALHYDEPPDWYYPVRQSLGYVLLAAGRGADAERVFRDDLARVPDDPWALYGLAQALRAAHRTADAAIVDGRFRTAWSRADMPFSPAAFEPFLAGRAEP